MCFCEGSGDRRGIQGVNRRQSQMFIRGCDFGFRVDGGGATYCDILRHAATWCQRGRGGSWLLRLVWNRLDVSGHGLWMPVVLKVA